MAKQSGASKGAKNWVDPQKTSDAAGVRLAHLRKDGKAHSGGPEHDFMHGRRGSKTWPDGRRKYDKDGNLILG